MLKYKIKFLGDMSRFGNEFTMYAQSLHQAFVLLISQLEKCPDYVKRRQFNIYKNDGTNMCILDFVEPHENEDVQYLCEPSVMGSGERATKRAIGGSMVGIGAGLSIGGAILVVLGTAVIAGSLGFGTPAGIALIISGTIMAAGGSIMMALGMTYLQQGIAKDGVSSTLGSMMPNTLKEGEPVPLVYGYCFTQALCASASSRTLNDPSNAMLVL